MQRLDPLSTRRPLFNLISRRGRQNQQLLQSNDALVSFLRVGGRCERLKSPPTTSLFFRPQSTLCINLTTSTSCRENRPLQKHQPFGGSGIIIRRNFTTLGRPSIIRRNTKTQLSTPATKNCLHTTDPRQKKEKQEDETTTTTSDPPILTWVDNYLPESAKPYARLARIDKPIGTWLLVWPCCWSTALASASVGGASSSYPDPFLLTLFGIGAITMRGAGCTINDLWDRDVDQQVARTRTRPLADGDLTVNQAIGFLAAQLSIGLGVLISLPNTWYCFQWGVASLPLVAIYPLTKRFLEWPQLFLGLTINWGAWMGWAATHGSMDWSIVPFLYGSGVTWTLVYDTIYAHQDKTDDAKLGLHSTAIAFGQDDDQQKRILHGLAALTWLQWLALGYNASEFVAFPYYQVGVTAAYAHLVWQINTADFNNPHNLADRFRSNSAVGALIFGSIAAGGFFQ